MQNQHSGFRVTGINKTNSNKLKAVKSTSDLFLGRVDKDVTISEIEAYIKEFFRINVIRIEPLIIKSNIYNAFKITVLSNERETLFNPELWPEGMVVNKFYNRRV